MRVFTSVQVALTFLLVGTQLTPSSSTLFTLLDPDTIEPCILVDVTFAVDVTAERENETIAEKFFTSEDLGIKVQGSCGEVFSMLNLLFPQRINWVLKFTMDEAGQVTLDRLVQFVPEKLFGDTVPVGDVQTMDDPGTDLGGASNSYTCSDLNIVNNDPITITTKDFNFTVSVAVERIQAQAFNVMDGIFSSPVDCKDLSFTATNMTSTATGTTDVTTRETSDTTYGETTTATSTEDTTAPWSPTSEKPTKEPITPKEPTTPEKPTTTTEDSTTTENPTTTKADSTTPENPTTTTEDSSTPDNPSTTTEDLTTPEETTTTKEQTTTSEQPTTSTTAPPVPDIQKYIVEEGNITCITLEAIIKLHIVYPLKQGGSNTATVQIPDNAITDGNCNLSKKTQNLSIIFYGGWFVQFMFEDKTKLNASGTNQHTDYKLQTIGVEFITDSNVFPGMSWEEGLIIPLSRNSSSYPKVSANQDYFRCNSSLKTEFSSTVSMETIDLRFKAFNDDDSQDFDGVEAVCGADRSTSSRVGVIIGIVVGGVMVLCVVAYAIVYVVIKRRNAYKTLVESDTWR